MNESPKPAKTETLTLGPLSGLSNMVVIRLKEFVRRPEAVFWVYGFPLLMVVILGFAFQNKPVENFTVDLQDSLDAKWKQKIEAACENDPRMELSQFDAEACVSRLKSGKSDFYIRGPSEKQEGESTEPAAEFEMEYVFDPTRPGSIVAKETFDDLFQEFSGRVNEINIDDFEFNQKGGRYIDWLIPGLLGMGLMGGGLWGVGFAIVDMRIRKLLKRFLATPMKRTHYLMAIMISRLLFMIPEMVLLVLFARIFFGVEIFGSMVDVILLILIGSIQFSGIGLLIGSRCRTLESASGLMNLTMLPMWTLSGIFFSYERFPESVHWLIQLLPLTPLIDALRAVMIEGNSIFMQWPELLVMTAWTIVSFTVALWIFRWGD